MKIYKIPLLLAAILPLSSPATESTFTVDNDGWIIIDHDSSTNPASEAGVNFTDNDPSVSDGRLVVQDLENAWNWIVAPPKFHGSWSSFTDLEMDLITVNAITEFNLRFFISDGSSSAWFEFPLTGTPGGTVLNLSAPLEEAEWNVTGSWEQMIGNVTAFFIRIDLSNLVGAEAEFVDRVALSDGTEPPAPTFPVTFDTALESEYQLESSVDLEVWKKLGQPLPGDGSEITIEVPLTDAPHRFFRARELENP
jgi:hypothetical protein